MRQTCTHEMSAASEVIEGLLHSSQGHDTGLVQPDDGGLGRAAFATQSVKHFHPAHLSHDLGDLGRHVGR